MFVFIDFAILLEKGSGFVRRTKFIKILILTLITIQLLGCSKFMQRSEDQSPAIDITTEEANANSPRNSDAEAFKRDVVVISFSDLKRNPEVFRGKKVTYVGKVFQVMELSNAFRLAVTPESQANRDLPNSKQEMNDTVWINFYPDTNGRSIQINDMVRIWGEVEGGKNSTSVAQESQNSEPEITARFFAIEHNATLDSKQVVKEPEIQVNHIEAMPSPTLEIELEDELLVMPTMQPEIDRVDSNPGYIDADEIEQIYVQYVSAMIESINQGDFGIVEPYLQAGSSLHKSQKSLVHVYRDRNVSEELIACDLLDYEIEDGTGDIKIKVHEVIRVNSPNGSRISDCYWIYTLDQNMKLFAIKRI